MKEIKTVAVIGLGNLGVAFGDYLSGKMPKKDLRFIADSRRIERYEKEKIYCNGKACDFQYVSPEEKGTPSDLIIITVKYQDLAEAVRAIKNQVGPDTVILSALNGITSEAVIAEAYGKDKVLYCVAQGMDGIKAGNRLDFDHMGMLCFGEKEAGIISERVKRVDDFFNRTGFPHEAETDMMKRMWGKLMMNVGVNQAAAVFLCNYGGLQAPGEARDVMIGAMREVIPLSEKEGYPLTEEDLSYWLKVLDSLRPEGKPSMQQDAEAGKTTEVELFSGTVISLGKKYGIACPVNEFLYREITRS